MMTDRPDTLPPPVSIPSQVVPILPPGPVAEEDETTPVEVAEEEPYTIKCICKFSGDDGNTIYCEKCDTWQHIECFYPENRAEAIREDFAHACADCHPRPLDRQKAVLRATQLKNGVAPSTQSEKKPKRPPPKSQKKKLKPGDGSSSDSKRNGGISDHQQQPAPKKPKTSHRPSQSVGSQAAKRSPSISQARAQHGRPPSPANSPPNLPEDFRIHHYSPAFQALWKTEFETVHDNTFQGLAVPGALARWLHDEQLMQSEVGHSRAEVFQDASSEALKRKMMDHQGKMQIASKEQNVDATTMLRWQYMTTPVAIQKEDPIFELNGEIGFQKDYCSDPENLWSDLSSPLPYVFFHPVLPLFIDTRHKGSQARFVRRSCRPNAQLDTLLIDGSEYQFWLIADRTIAPNEQITLPWDFRLDKSVGSRWLHLLGLSDDDASRSDEPEMSEIEYNAISNWIDRILSEYGGCACDLENNCAFARFHRLYLYSKNPPKTMGKKKQRKHRTQAISPTSTGQVSRAASEGHGEDDTRSQTDILRSKPSSRDPTPARQGSLDQNRILTEPTDRDKRKVAMVEDSFRRMEQQQPARKKKRVSDGTSTSSKSNRNGSTSNYKDAGTGGSKNGSPNAANSPQLPNGSKRRTSSHQRSRQASDAPRPVYCSAGTQTDPVEDDWFSKPPAQPRKRVISLAKRLLQNRKLCKLEDERRRREPLTPRTSSGSAMDVELPNGIKASAGAETASPATSQFEDTHMGDAHGNSSPASEDSSKKKTPDLRVQMPPVPAFDNTGLRAASDTAPASASSTAQSPLSTSSLPTPFLTGGMNGFVQPSPAKKKLSLSDYTRRSKAASKVTGDAITVRSTLLSPAETKVEIVMDDVMSEAKPTTDSTLIPIKDP